MFTRPFLTSIPKVDIHLHLDGSVRPQTVLELAAERNVDLGSELQDAASILSYISCVNDCNSLEEYLQGFILVNKVLQDAVALKRVAFELCEDAVKDGCAYIEIRFGPSLHTQGGLSLTQVMDAVCSGAKAAERQLPITVRLIVTALRNEGAEMAMKLVEVAIRYKSSGVVAFDIAGPENGFQAKDYAEAFLLGRKNGLYSTVHAGEAFDHRSIKQSVRRVGAHRIGHGTSIIEDEALMDYFAYFHIPIEVCMTSNIHTKVVTKYEDHPVRKMVDHGLSVVLCTDNRTISEITLTDEYVHFVSAFNASSWDILTLLKNGVSATFLTPLEKKSLLDFTMRQVVPALVKMGALREEEFVGDRSYIHHYLPDKFSLDSLPSIDNRWGVDAIQRMSKVLLNYRVCEEDLKNGYPWESTLEMNHVQYVELVINPLRLGAKDGFDQLCVQVLPKTAIEVGLIFEVDLDEYTPAQVKEVVEYVIRGGKSIVGWSIVGLSPERVGEIEESWELSREHDLRLQVVAKEGDDQLVSDCVRENYATRYVVAHPSLLIHRADTLQYIANVRVPILYHVDHLGDVVDKVEIPYLRVLFDSYIRCVLLTVDGHDYDRLAQIAQLHSYDVSQLCTNSILTSFAPIRLRKRILDATHTPKE